MIPAGGQKRRFLPVTLSELKAEHITIKAQRPIEISDFQVDVPNAHVRMNPIGHLFLLPRKKRTRQSAARAASGVSMPPVSETLSIEWMRTGASASSVGFACSVSTHMTAPAW